jgi:hypothetical protein
MGIFHQLSLVTGTLESLGVSIDAVAYQTARGRSKVDWLVIWKIYHYPFFFWIYTVLSVATRLLMLGRLKPALPAKARLVSSAASLLVVPAMPFLAMPAFLFVALVAGQRAVYSFCMAAPIAVSIGCTAALLDATLFHLLLRQRVGKKRMGVVIAMNIFITALAVGAIVALILVRPPEIIATVVR